MKAEQQLGGVLLTGVKDFYPDHVFDCGQAFRWEKDEKGYRGIVADKAVRIQYQSQTLLIENSTLEDYTQIWHSYFDFDRDYSCIKEMLEKDPVLKRAIHYGWGMRILNQDPWETLISFILSANNNIQRIRQIIKRLSIAYGKPVFFDGLEYHTFPTPQVLTSASDADLRLCGCGYRAPYIKETARMVKEGELPLSDLQHYPYGEAFARIQSCMGVGPKVADCILLFSLGQTTAFPVDVWVKRVMEHYYCSAPMSVKGIKDLAIDLFGAYGGLAQQYLFYYAREMKIGK